MRAALALLALAAAGFVLAGCPSHGACPVDTISSASQCIPIADMSVNISDLAGLTATCPPFSSLTGQGGPPLPPCVISTRCFYDVTTDDAGVPPQECDCGQGHRWFCLAK